MVTFYLVGLLLSWPAMLLWRLPADFRLGDADAARAAYANVGLAFGFGPGLAALLTTFVYARAAGLRDLFRRVVAWRTSPGWYAAALLTPVLVNGLALEAWSFHSGLPLADSTHSWAHWLQVGLAVTLFSIGEELGWRGFLLPRVLARTGSRRAAMIVGGLWAVWHYPLYFAVNWAMTGSTSRTCAILALATVAVLALSVFVTWIFEHSRGSVLLAMIFHGSANASGDLVNGLISKEALQSGDFLPHFALVAVIAAALPWVLMGRNRGLPRRT